jgi:hypothetical protein
MNRFLHNCIQVIDGYFNEGKEESFFLEVVFAMAIREW